MVRIILVLIFSCIINLLTAQVEKYSKVKINITDIPLQYIAELGLEIDHGIVVKHRYIINDYSLEEIDILKQNGIPHQIIIEDVVAWYQDPTRSKYDDLEISTRDDCTTASNDDLVLDKYESPINYNPGSMAGYFTLSEMDSILENMILQYPNLISAKTPIDTIKTHEGRDIFWFRISNQPNEDTDKPEVLYTALHHAREPNSMAQLLFYMWYLLENYDTNTQVKHLVDHTEMYFIPCVNPDGYVYNETNNPNGGGLWRKNRRVNETGPGNGSFGVDLNRNYGFEWGYDDIGSSTNPNSETYRGIGPFSEPETQAVKVFCEQHEFKIALNYHTYGDLLIHPWGYEDGPTEDDAIFKGLGSAMTKENDYFVGTGLETVGYTVNGDSDDWMYGEEMTKPKIFSLTPEAGPGNFGFWPPFDAIEDINKYNIHQNLAAAQLLLKYYDLEGEKRFELEENIGSFASTVTRYGFLEGSVDIQFTSDNPRFNVASNLFTVDLDQLESQVLPISYEYTPDEDIAEETIELDVVIDYGDYQLNEVYFFEYSNLVYQTELVDHFEDTDNWNADTDWALTPEEFTSSPTSFTDSPNTLYQGGDENILNMETEIDLTNAINARIQFQCKWDIEASYDFAQVLASIDGEDFIPLCGNHTILGNNNQDLNQPLFDGVQNEWVLETMNLNDFLGETVQLRFRIVSDNFVEGDGFYFDDFEVQIINDGTSNTTNLKSIPLKVYPNPSDDFIQLEWDNSFNYEMVNIYDILGHKIMKHEDIGLSPIKVDISTLEQGIYFVELSNDHSQSQQKRIIVK